MIGEVYLIGAGPGDPGLMTVRGLDMLRKADVIVYDALIDYGLLSENKDAELIDVGKRGGNHKKSQHEINELLVELAVSGKTVVRLKGGDPFMFGRGAEEAAVLRKAGVKVHVIPGVSSTISVPELAGIPVTHRDHASNVTFVTGHEKSDRSKDRVDWASLAGTKGTLVILMGMGNTESITRGLMEGGMSGHTPVGIITDGSTDRQRVEITELCDLTDTVIKRSLSSPGIIIVGDVVREYENLGDLR